jgi:DNA-binding cell septation regulator SpoVG
MEIKVSEVQVMPIKPRDGLVGFASIVFENSFYLSSIGIFTRPQGGYRLTYPTRKGLNGNFNIFHPINKAVGEHIEKVVISKFEEVVKCYDRHDNSAFE